jgi:hypothetical protein
MASLPTIARDASSVITERDQDPPFPHHCFLLGGQSGEELEALQCCGIMPGTPLGEAGQQWQTQKLAKTRAKATINSNSSI